MHCNKRREKNILEKFTKKSFNPLRELTIGARGFFKFQFFHKEETIKKNFEIKTVFIPFYVNYQPYH